jgi:hypothetical protein
MDNDKIITNFFFVNRKLLHSDRWLSEKFTRGQAWIDLFGLAQHSKGFIRIRGIKITLERGQLAYSQLKLSKRWKWSRGKVRRYLKELENDNDISLKTIHQTGQQIKFVTTLITIIGYSNWQGDNTASNTANGHQTGQQTDTKQDIYNKNNNENNEKKRERPLKKSGNSENENYFSETAERLHEEIYGDVLNWNEKE